MLNNQMKTIVEQVKLHSVLFCNAILEISNEDAQRRLSNQTNHIAWLAGALVSGRYEIAAMLGIKQKETFAELFAGNKGIQGGVIYPHLNQLEKDWLSISPILTETLSSLTDEQTATIASPFKEYYIIEDSFMGAITFIIDRESYIIGQIALLRKIFGYNAMEYPFNNKQV